MNRTLTRGLLLLILIGGLSYRLAPRADLGMASWPAEERLAQVAADRLLQPVSGERRVYHLLLAGCSEPVTVVITQPTFTPRAVLLQRLQPGYHSRYAYLDWSARDPDRIAVLLRRISQPLLGMVRMSRFADSREMLFIAEANQCSVADEVDWSKYWQT